MPAVFKIGCFLKFLIVTYLKMNYKKSEIVHKLCVSVS